MYTRTRTEEPVPSALLAKLTMEEGTTFASRPYMTTYGTLRLHVKHHSCRGTGGRVCRLEHLLIGHDKVV